MVFDFQWFTWGSMYGLFAYINWNMATFKGEIGGYKKIFLTRSIWVSDYIIEVVSLQTSLVCVRFSFSCFTCKHTNKKQKKQKNKTQKTKHKGKETNKQKQQNHLLGHPQISSIPFVGLSFYRDRATSLPRSLKEKPRSANKSQRSADKMKPQRYNFWKERIIFQPSIFRAYVIAFFGGGIFFNHNILWECQFLLVWSSENLQLPKRFEFASVHSFCWNLWKTHTSWNGLCPNEQLVWEKGKLNINFPKHRMKSWS